MSRPRKQHLTREEERELSRRSQAGDIQARHKLVEAHYPFVVWVADRYTGCGVSNEEMIQAGVLGLLEAIERDNLGEVRLLTFGFWAIRRHIIAAIRESTVFSSDGAYNRAIRYSLDGGVPEELRKPVSLDQLIGDDSEEQQTLGATLIDTKAPDPSDAADDGEGIDIAKAALRNMKTRTRQIVRMRIGLSRGDKQPGMSFVAIAKHFKISAERARRIYITAIRRLKRKMEDE